MLYHLQKVVRHIAQTEVIPRFLNTPSRRKEDGSVLSEADLAAQTAFAAALPLLENCPMLGEGMSVREQTRLWNEHSDGLRVINPIDGIDNFVNNLPHFAISVVLVKNGRIKLGVIYNPASGECSCAERGKGAFLNDMPLPLRSVEEKLSESIAGVEIRYLHSDKLASHINTLAPFGTIRSMGSSTLDWCCLTSGRYDIYIHDGQKLWDYAAGALIFEKAGDYLITLEGDDFWGSERAFKHSVIVALQPGLFKQQVKWIRENQ